MNKFIQRCSLIVMTAALAACSSSGGSSGGSWLSSSGGYYKDDGPPAQTPANLDNIPDAVPRIEPLAHGQALCP